MKLFYVVTEDWFFYIHRLPTLRAAVEQGLEVTLVARVQDHQDRIEVKGVRVLNFPFKRKSKNPFGALAVIIQLALLYKKEKPDIVHHIALKPILFGSIAAYFARVPFVVNGYVGLGSLFYSDILLVRILRPIIFPFLRKAAKKRNIWTLFENSDDCQWMINSGMANAERTVVVPGSGVDITRYRAASLPEGDNFICMFAGRMIAMKGLQTIKDAFDLLKDSAPHVRLWLCGMPDPGNPESWTAKQLTDWCRDNPNVIWKGHQADMAECWPQVHLALQPTIGGEGLPVSLLEAGACARPMIATDVPGCREIVIDGENGIMIPEQDAAALAAAILELSADRERCRMMGLASRNLVERRFSADIVTNSVAEVYSAIVKA